MASDRQKITDRYATEKHKRFFFPIRPLFTLGSGLFFGALYLFGLMPIAWALIFTAGFAFDDLPLAPFIKFIRAANNLSNGRKKLKSIVMLTSITLATIAGALLAFFIFAHNPAFMLGAAAFVVGTGCSPICLFLGGVLGAMIADKTKKVTSVFGISTGLAIGFIVGFSLPATAIPLIANAVFITAVSGAFAGAIVAKQVLRFYFYCRYGHSNADGYNMARTPKAQEAFVLEQAKKFDVSIEVFKKLTEHCKTRIAEIKKEASFMHALTSTSFANPFTLYTWCMDEFRLKRNYQSNAYKDIYHGLMAKKVTTETIENVKALLKDSKPIPEESAPKERPHYPYLFSGERQSDLQARTFFHQCNLADSGGIKAELIEPFFAHTN
ncbi:MAG: hypothetical protein K0U37_08710 [Gammaproteobacteria bacterium]|nr:hypothetical protein [Gammaproteobacteria bacterium]